MTWENFSCPQCEEEIQEEGQVRCDNCKVLFDWEDEE
tara:strand:+ start:79 stop:189 length:111 start_codon:yes stop_codon:yes gene_type:complete